jgi:hypothetical protein
LNRYDEPLVHEGSAVMSHPIEFDGRHGNLYLLKGNEIVTHNVTSGRETTACMDRSPGEQWGPVRLSPDKSVLAVSEYAPGPELSRLVLYDIMSGRSLPMTDTLDQVTAFTFFPDNGHLAVGYTRSYLVGLQELSRHHPDRARRYRETLSLSSMHEQARLCDLHLAVLDPRAGAVVFDVIVCEHAWNNARISGITIPSSGRRLACDIRFEDYRVETSDAWYPFTSIFHVTDDMRLDKILDLRGSHRAGTVFDHDGRFFVSGEDEDGYPSLYTADGDRCSRFEGARLERQIVPGPIAAPFGDPIGFTRDQRFFVRLLGEGVSWGKQLVLHDIPSGRQFAAFAYCGMYEHACAPSMSLDHESLIYTSVGDEYYGGYDGVWTVMFHLHYEDRRPLYYKRLCISP